MHEEVSHGVESLLSPSVVDATSALSSLHESQAALAAEIEHLTENLESYSKGSEISDLKPTLAKLQDTGKRLSLVNDTLRQIEVRLLGVKKELLIRNMKRTKGPALSQ